MNEENNMQGNVYTENSGMNGVQGPSQGNGYTNNDIQGNAPKKSGFDKTIFIICITVVTIVCIIAGTLVHLVGKLSFDGFGRKGIDWGNYITEENTLDAFSSINVDADLLSVTVAYGDEFFMKYKGPEKLKPIVELQSDGTLSISQKQIMNVSLDNNKNLNCSCELTIPENTVLQMVSLNMDLGNIEMDDIQMKDMVVDTDLGNVVLTKIEIEDSITIDADLGNIELHQASFNQGEFDADLGNINIDRCEFDSAVVEADMGNIAVGDSFNQITADCNMGAIQVSGADLDKDVLHLTTDMGAVEVNGKGMGKEYHHN